MNASAIATFAKARLLALKRRLSIAVTGSFDPYPPVPEGMSFSPSEHTSAAAAGLRPEHDWKACPENAVPEWQDAARERFRSLLRVPEKTQPLTVLEERDMPIADGFRRRRVYVRFSDGCDAPLDIVTKAGAEDSGHRPVVICMQGTNAGAHLNLGEVRMPADVYKVARGSALALQAADNGFVAVSFERACFGERAEKRLDRRSDSPTVDAAFHALLVGETLLGQTVCELVALRDWIETELVPGAPVYMAGYSAAGTASIAAAAADADFAGIAVGGCVGFIRDTLLTRGVSGFNDIPDMLRHFEFDAQLALVAPRPCVIVAGKSDPIWPYEGAEAVAASASRAWKGMSEDGNIRLVEASGGHTYYPDLMWPNLDALLKR